MSHHRVRLFPARGRSLTGVAVTVAAAGLLGMTAVAGVTGCSSINSSSSNSTTSMTTRIGAFSASQLRAALLTRVNGAGPAAKPEAGSYGSIPAIQAAAKALALTRVTPKQCMRATVLQAIILDTGALGSAPAAIVDFKVGTNGVTEVLAAPADSATAASLSKPIPASCARYTVYSQGKAYHFSVRQSWVTGIGVQRARVLGIKTAGVKGSLWTLLYQGTGFVGTIAVDGPNATEAAVREIATQAYDYAAKALP
jgi:hypothetical protein